MRSTAPCWTLGIVVLSQDLEDARMRQADLGSYRAEAVPSLACTAQFPSPGSFCIVSAPGRASQATQRRRLLRHVGLSFVACRRGQLSYHSVVGPAVDGPNR